MRVGRFFILTALLIFFHRGEAQTLSFSGTNISLEEMFTVIKNQAGIVFFYEADLLSQAKPVTVRWKNVTLQTALNDVFKGQPFYWMLEDKTVSITNTNKLTASVSQPARPIKAKGIITDQGGQPIAGASVRIKNTQQGTLSDSLGRFSITTDRKNILILSAINYSSKEVRLEAKEMNIQLRLAIKELDDLLVGGNFNAVKRRELSTSVTVLDWKTLEKIPSNTLDQIFRGWVPGTNSFDIGDAPEGFPTLVIRGAAGPYSLSQIAVYVDGIEYAGGSGYLSQLDKTNIDRIEIMKGPGAATLYGTGSNGGIVQIFTKKPTPGASSVSLTTSAGFYKSKWVKSDPLQQLHAVETQSGFKNVALTVGGSYRMVNAYLPDGGEKNKAFYGSIGTTVGKLRVNLTGRYNNRFSHVSRKPYFDTATHPRSDIIIEPVVGTKTPAYVWFSVFPAPSQNKDKIVETFISGLNLAHKTTNNWVNHLDAGYTINNNTQIPLQNGYVPLQNQYFSSKSNITTIRYYNVLSLYNNSDGMAATITSGAEYKKYSALFSVTGATVGTTSTFSEPDNINYGAFVQARPSYKNVYLTVGLRYEKNELFNAAWNPRLGITTNFDIRSLTIKPRISWGQGITSPTYLQRFGRAPTAFAIFGANPELKAQSQAGFDYGVEVYDRKGAFRFELVYYDNILKDIIAMQTLGADSQDSSRTVFNFINTAKVTNKGWEFSVEYRSKRLTLRGTSTIMKSTLKDTTGAYLTASLSDKAPGTSMPNLPRYTAGLSLDYNFYKLFGKADKGVISLSLTEVAGVKYFDYTKYRLDVAYGRTPYVPQSLGTEVENSVVRLGIYADYFIANDLRFFVQASNILNDYTYEFSSEFPTHGATWLFGFKYNYSKGSK